MRSISLKLSYFLAVTPRGVLGRLSGDPMNRGWDPDAASYWVRLDGGTR